MKKSQKVRKSIISSRKLELFSVYSIVYSIFPTFATHGYIAIINTIAFT